MLVLDTDMMAALLSEKMVEMGIYGSRKMVLTQWEKCRIQDWLAYQLGHCLGHCYELGTSLG